MTPLRACQVSAQLLHRIETHALAAATADQDKPILAINEEELAALHVLHAVTIRMVTGHYQPKPR